MIIENYSNHYKHFWLSAVTWLLETSVIIKSSWLTYSNHPWLLVITLIIKNCFDLLIVFRGIIWLSYGHFSIYHWISALVDLRFCLKSFMLINKSGIVTSPCKYCSDRWVFGYHAGPVVREHAYDVLRTWSGRRENRLSTLSPHSAPPPSSLLPHFAPLPPSKPELRPCQQRTWEHCEAHIPRIPPLDTIAFYFCEFMQ